MTALLLLLFVSKSGPQTEEMWNGELEVHMKRPDNVLNSFQFSKCDCFKIPTQLGVFVGA